MAEVGLHHKAAIRDSFVGFPIQMGFVVGMRKMENVERQGYRRTPDFRNSERILRDITGLEVSNTVRFQLEDQGHLLSTFRSENSFLNYIARWRSIRLKITPVL